MATGILGKKIGMTQVYGDDGKRVSVTVIEAGPCPILAIRQKSLQLGFDNAREKSLTKPIAGYFKKINIKPLKYIQEVAKDPTKEYKIGECIKIDMFKPGDYVDITGFSLGKGFQGGMKRWNWQGGPMTHGSMSHRRIGSLGSSTTPGRVWKGHHLPGHMGNVRVTIQSLKVVSVDIENNLLAIRGGVPGYKNSYCIVKRAKKKKFKEAPKAKT